MTVQKDLFGGAIVADLPTYLVDASDLRQVPDNQEVFLYPNSTASIIIEILQRVEEPDDLKAVKFHFDALAHDNDAISNTIETSFVLDNHGGGLTPAPIILRGSQLICKFNATIPDDVVISIALFRVNSGGKSVDVVVSENTPKSGVGEERISSEFNTLISSLRIINFDLFC